jgi:hypothetical protein
MPVAAGVAAGIVADDDGTEADVVAAGAADEAPVDDPPICLFIYWFSVNSNFYFMIQSSIRSMEFLVHRFEQIQKHWESRDHPTLGK